MRPVERIVIDALQLAPEFSGIGRRLLDMGRDLRRQPPEIPLRVRCAEDVVDRLREAFPPGTEFVTPIRSSRPRARRVAYQQLVAPFIDGPTTLLVCPGDQAPVWGRSQILFVLHDVRRVTVPQSAGNRLEEVYYRLVIRRGVRRASVILTISEFSRREISRLYRPSAPIAVVKSPIELPVSRGAVNGAGPLLIVGALRPYKGLETLIGALSRLAADGAEVPRLICVGTDETGSGYAARLRALASERGVAPYFELRGWVSDDELEALRATCIGAISPSDYEGFGLPLAESLASGLPTIASSIPPHREVAGDAALFFEPGDDRSLAAALTQLLADPGLRDQLSEAGIRRAADFGSESISWAEAICSAAQGAFGSRPETGRGIG
jgi:glycosyltransferase involved in cell wall biosynthesis